MVPRNLILGESENFRGVNFFSVGKSEWCDEDKEHR